MVFIYSIIDASVPVDDVMYWFMYLYMGIFGAGRYTSPTKAAAASPGSIVSDHPRVRLHNHSYLHVSSHRVFFSFAFGFSVCRATGKEAEHQNPFVEHGVR
ncbi:hypothetical protein Drorol1_Dr00002762 [Drosera rotundifolia]